MRRNLSRNVTKTPIRIRKIATKASRKPNPEEWDSERYCATKTLLRSYLRYSTVPFYGTYQIKELGFSMVFVSILAVAYAIIRALFERPIGKIADKKGFASSLNVCYVVEIAALVVAVFTRPENGSVMYTIHYVLYAICTAGISSGELNLVYDYVKPNERVAALAIKATAAGLAGFLTTLALSPLVSLIQTNGLVLFGVNIYAQQITSFIGLVACVLLVVYNVVVVKKIKR